MADKPTLPKGAGRQLGASGTVIYRGIITQEEYNRNLTGRNGNRQYEIMRRSDSTIRSALQVCKLPVLTADWRVDPAKGKDGAIDAKDQYVADFINYQLFHSSINFPDLIRSILTCLDFGFSIHEKVNAPCTFEGKTMIGLAKLASRKQYSVLYWETQDSNPGIQQQVIGQPNASIPMDKLLVVTHDKEGDNYEGISLLRYVYKDWKIKDDLTIVNAIAIEKMAVGVPIVQEREGSTDSSTEADRAKAEEILSEMRANERSYLMLPRTLSVEMLDMKAASNKEVIPTLQYHDRRISQSILAQFMDLGGSSGTGSHSLSKDLTALFMKSEEALARTIAAAINEQVIKQLCDLNFTEMPNGYPELTFGKIADDDTAALATALNALSGANLLTPDADLEDHLRAVYRLPAMSQKAKDGYDEQHQPVDKTVTPDSTGNTKKPKETKDVNAALADAHRYRERLLGMVAEG